MSSFAVEPTGLETLAAFARSAAEQAQGAVERLRNEADALFATGWHGSAASSFRVGWEQWADGAARVVAALDELAVLVAASAVDYTQTDEAVRVGVSGSTA